MELQIEIPEFIYPAFYNDFKYSLIPAGRRTGKTYNATQWLIEQLLINPGSQGLWVDTVQANLDAYVKRYFKPILGSLWNLCYYNERKGLLEFPNGSLLDLRSSQKPENLEGFAYQFVVINEAGIVLRKQELWYNTIYPMTKGDCQVKLIGTPKGKNVFHKLFAMALDEETYGQFQFSAYESPFWEREELDRIKTLVPEQVWQQEYMAMFVDGGGSVFRNIGRILHDDWVDIGVPGKNYILGVDLAKHQDFTVITVAELDTGKVVYIERFNQLDWNVQAGRIVTAWKKFNKGALILDSSGVGDAIFDNLINMGVPVIPFKFTNASKKLIVRNLIVATENQEISIPNYDILIAELELFEIQSTPSGNITYNAPDGMHDDCVISLALANHLLHENTEEDDLII